MATGISALGTLTLEELDDLHFRVLVTGAVSGTLSLLSLCTIHSFERKRPFPGNLYWWPMYAQFMLAFLILTPAWAGWEALALNGPLCSVVGMYSNF